MLLGVEKRRAERSRVSRKTPPPPVYGIRDGNGLQLQYPPPPPPYCTTEPRGPSLASGRRPLIYHPVRTQKKVRGCKTVLSGHRQALTPAPFSASHVCRNSLSTSRAACHASRWFDSSFSESRPTNSGGVATRDLLRAGAAPPPPLLLFSVPVASFPPRSEATTWGPAFAAAAAASAGPGVAGGGRGRSSPGACLQHAETRE